PSEMGAADGGALELDDSPTSFSSGFSLHDALPISANQQRGLGWLAAASSAKVRLPTWSCSIQRRSPIKRLSKSRSAPAWESIARSEEHTSELQSPYDIVSRLRLATKTRTCPTTQSW